MTEQTVKADVKVSEPYQARKYMDGLLHNTMLPGKIIEGIYSPTNLPDVLDLVVVSPLPLIFFSRTRLAHEHGRTLFKEQIGYSLPKIICPLAEMGGTQLATSPISTSCLGANRHASNRLLLLLIVVARAAWDGWTCVPGLVLRGHIMPPGVRLISRYKPF